MILAFLTVAVAPLALVPPAAAAPAADPPKPAGPTVEGHVLAGARTAPESAIQLPSEQEGGFDPSALLAASVAARFAGASPVWARVELGGWGYAPDLDASLATAAVAGGVAGKAGETDLAAAARYDVQVFPGILAASNGRAEAVADVRRAWSAWALAGRLTAVDRRFVGEVGLSTVEVGPTLSYATAAWGLDVGVSGQGNGSAGGTVGAQGRTRLRLRVGGERWQVAAEHRFTWAFEGEAEGETRAAFTPIGDYADDVDALSGGGFLQQRVGLSAAVTAGAWTASAGGFARFRSAEDEEEAAVAFVRTGNAQARLGRTLRPGVEAFVAGGVATATTATGRGYVDGFGWVGLDLRSGAR